MTINYIEVGLSKCIAKQQLKNPPTGVCFKLKQ